MFSVIKTIIKKAIKDNAYMHLQGKNGSSCAPCNPSKWEANFEDDLRLRGLLQFTAQCTVFLVRYFKK